MPIALVQSDIVIANGVNNTTKAFTSSVTAGNLLVVTQFHRSTAAAAITDPVDTLSHAYVAATAEQMSGVTVRRFRTFYIPNCSGGANAVTFDIAGTDTAGTELIGFISEWSGVAGASPISGTPVLAGPTNTATPATGNTTPAVDGCLLYAALACPGLAGLSMAEEAGWTELENQINATNICGGIAYQIQTVAAADGHTWTLSNSVDTLCHVVAFRPAVAGVGGAIFNTLALVGHGR